MTHGVETFAARNNAAPPRRIGQRYTQKRFLPEPGNTVICALDITDPAHQAVKQARARIADLPGASRYLLFTAPDSLHMTLFEGTIDTRRTSDAWPATVPLDAPVAATTETIDAALDVFTAPPAFRVKVADIYPGGLHLEGATLQDAVLMRDWRDRLTTPFGYRHDRHDDYSFHMTFAYPLDWISDDHVPVWQAALADILAELQSACPVLPLSDPAFCTFNDMNRFDPVRVIHPSAL